MSEYSKRLRWIRESLRRPDGRPVDRQALSRALGWPEKRWKNLEGELPWGDGSKLWVREGLLALVARTTLPEEAGQRAVDYVFGETAKKPWSSPPTWREGQCPEPKRVGRPPVSGVEHRVAQAEVAATRFDDDPVRRALRPPLNGVARHAALRRAQVAAVLRTLLAGEIDELTAEDAIDNAYGYYYDKFEPSAGRLPPGA